MSTWEYDLHEFKLVEKWSAKKQAEKLAELRAELNSKGSTGWELLGLHSFDLVGGVLGGDKGKGDPDGVEAAAQLGRGRR